MKKLLGVILVGVLAFLATNFSIIGSGGIQADLPAMARPGTVLVGATSALKGMPNTFMLISRSEQALMLGWPGCSGWCYTLVDGVSKTPLKWQDLFGTYVQPSDIGEMVKAAMENGWRRVDPRDLALTPFARKIALANQSYAISVMDWFSKNSTILPLFSLTPTESFDIFYEIVPFVPGDDL